MTDEQIQVDIDEAQIAGENGQVYLFQWLSSTENKIRHSTPDFLKAHQAAFEATLVKVITAPEPYPIPGRVLRNITARSLIALYTHGESRTLFDTLQAFIKVVADFKTPDKDMNKMYASQISPYTLFTHWLQRRILLRRRVDERVWL